MGPATLSGRIVKSKKGKKGTPHQKNHRWESFNTKISQFNSLNSLRAVRHHGLDTEDLSTTTSYLKAGLEKWQELNTTDRFIRFSSEVLPLCDSLPQILHFEDKIMGIMVIYIETREKDCLEPLLELMTNFAHDLGARFEKHYAKALETVASIAAATPKDVEVIEWSFTCLAFMFKYLSKLLVPDLRPTYNLMAPLLGKLRQQPHIARFAAEAMSFLIKKAGAPAHRAKALPLIVQHAKLSLLGMVDTREFVLYYHGIMTLFAEAMKGTELNVHTSATSILKALFLGIDEQDLSKKEASPWIDVVCGVLTSIIHHTRPETFQEIADLVLAQANSTIETFTASQNECELRRLLVSARTIGIVAGVRMGSRIRDWPTLVKVLANILKTVSQNAHIVSIYEKDVDLWNNLILSSSIVLHYAPMDTIIPSISSIMDSLSKDPLANWFLIFCSYLSQADQERFRDVALPYFHRFVVAHWSDDNGDALCVLLPKMVSLGVLPNHHGRDGFKLPQSWQDQIVSKFERLEVSPFPEQASPAVYDRSPTTWHDRCLPKYNALLEVLECTIVHPSTNARIAEILLRKLKLALRPSSSLALEEANFIVGRGFRAFSRMSKGAGEVDRALEPLLRAAAPRYARLPKFLEALLLYEKCLKLSPTLNPLQLKSGPITSISSDEGETDLLVSSLIANLSTESHDLRLLSLRLLEHLDSVDNSTPLEELSLMIKIEQTPLDLQSVRSASMHIRKLATLYKNQPLGSWLQQAVPSFCFGMLTVKMSQIWEDITAALKQIAQSKPGEEAIAALAIDWLETPSLAWEGSTKNANLTQNNGLTDFECSNLIRLDHLAEVAESEICKSRDTMLQNFEDAQQLVSVKSSSARSQALRVFSSMPQTAEKHSRQVVPMFLSWATKQGSDTDLDIEGQEATLSDWNRKDQKAQLALFGQFVNPKSLYMSENVYNALLELLGNGDIEIQRSALKAIFTWKNKSIRPYEENLLNLLDEARFKDEITILLQSETLVQSEHRLDLMPVLLHLLYGRSISRKGSASGKQGMEATRLTILKNLRIEELEGFLDIALGELKDVKLVDNGAPQRPALDKKILSVRKQVGFINMMEGVLKELGTKVVSFAQKLVDAVLYCLVFVSRRLEYETKEIDDNENHSSQISLLKVVRQTGLKCLILLFTNAVDFDWSPYMGIIIDDVVLPRLENLPIETAQGISGILRLFSTWSSSSKTVLLLGRNDQILGKVAQCATPKKSKDEVKLFALNIIRNVIKLCHDDTNNHETVKEELLTPNMDAFLTQIGGVLRGQQDMSKELLEACVETVSELAPFVSNSTQGHNLVDVSVFLLDQPSRRVNPKTKSSLLLVLEHFVPLYDLQNDAGLKDRVYHTVTSLFGFFKDNESRDVLSKVLLVYSQNDPVMGDVAKLCLDLNSFVEGRLDKPDYNRRLKAFNILNAPRQLPFTPHQWAPLVFNMLFYIKADEEYGVLSSNSSNGICQFIDAASKADSEKATFESMLSSIIIPALFAGARESSEVIRREYLKAMAHLVRTFSTWPEVSDMHGLLAGEDEVESSFFNNIITAGKGRQSGALSILSKEAQKGELSAKNVSHFFIPLIEHFIFDRAEGSDAHSLAAEATTTVGDLCGSLEWPQYRAMLLRYIRYVQAKPELEKQIIRLVGRVIGSLTLAAQTPVGAITTNAPELSPIIANPLVETVVPKRNTLAKTMPNQLKLAEDLTSNILPPLVAYINVQKKTASSFQVPVADINAKEKSVVSLRVPVAIIIVRLLKLLPEEQLKERLPAVLTDICHILRSKAQESRDMTRDTLVKICVLLGPSCFGFVLKELRGALAKGYQLHVLSYTMHSILVATTPEYAPGDLDYCIPSMVAIIMDDIFGAIGQEKDAEEYVSKIKEVKSSKSHDSMELIAKTATLGRLTDLIRPIQALLEQKLNLKMVRKIDELLNRISTGLLRNPAAQSRDSLLFCWEVIQDVYKSQEPQAKVKVDYKVKKYLIQKGAKKSDERGSTTIYTFKLVRFALDLLRSILTKYDNLRTSNNLVGFISIIGGAVVQGEEEVKVAAFRLLTTIVKVPVKGISNGNIEATKDISESSKTTGASGTDLYRIATEEATKCISESSTTSSDIAQASLKLISVVLRDHSDAIVKNRNYVVDKLLSKLKDDMTEPERRTVTYNFLRAVLDAEVETAVVYDTLDYVRTVMVTNDDIGTRDLARGSYFQFLRNYPQKKKRWIEQLIFLKDNLLYKIEGGRLQILEVIHLLLLKSSDNHAQEVAGFFFIPLASMLLKDEETKKCRDSASEVIKEIFKKADEERMPTFLKLLRSWIKDERIPVNRMAFQMYGLYYDSQLSLEGRESEISMLQHHILSTLSTAEATNISDMQTILSALNLTSTLLHTFPTLMLSPATTPIWTSILPCLSFPSADIKLAASLLTSTYFGSFTRAPTSLSLPLSNSTGLSLTGDSIIAFIRRISNMLKTLPLANSLADPLAAAVIKNLGFLACCAAENDLRWKPALSQGAESDSEEEENEKEEPRNLTVLQYLLSRLSYNLRHETTPPRLPYLLPKTASLTLLLHLTTHLPAPSLTPCLYTILLPLHHLTDPSIPTPYSIDGDFKTAYQNLKSESEAIMENLKRKLGTGVYSEALLKVREEVMGRREERGRKRRVERVREPERYGEMKRRKGERKKEVRKVRGMEHRSRRAEY